MQKRCSSPETMDEIINHLTNGLSKHVYILFWFLWFIGKVIHDCLLLYGCQESTTLVVGFVTFFFHLAGVVSVFFWAMGVAGVFIANVEFSGSKCHCYYRWPQLQMLLSFVSPFVSFQRVAVKFDNVVRACLSGDFLYCVQY